VPPEPSRPRSQSAAQAALHAARRSLAGTEPPRYEHYWSIFYDEVRGALAPGARVLDIGSGAEPTVPPPQRPEGMHYAGLDVSAAELDRAPAGSYDQTLVADLVHPRPELQGGFDLIVSRQVLEHVRPLPAAIANLHRWLRPGGTMVHRLSGARSLPSLLNRALPERAAEALERRLRGREPDSIFPAHYDHCTHDELVALLAPFARATVIPQFLGARYFPWSRPACAVYLGFEEVLYRRDLRNLATYYVVSARR